jgi:pancreatic lipase-related protein 2
MCRPIKDDQAIAGEDCRSSAKGIYFITTNADAPFALGRITDLIQTKSINTISFSTVRNVDPFLKEIDDFGKLQGNFNNLPYPKSFDNDDNYFTNHGSDTITHNYIDRLRHKNPKLSDKSSMKYKVRKSSKLLKDYS